ncbi:MAG: hypothetical protein ACYSUN_10730 [Planctomycetota bacterium]
MRTVEFLREKATDMPSSARRLCEHFGSIVQAATAAWFRGVDLVTAVECRRRPNRKRCRGNIELMLIDDSKPIYWSCTSCGDAGRIEGWRGCSWDMSDLESAKASKPGDWIEVGMLKDVYRELTKCRFLDGQTRRVILAAQAQEWSVTLGAPRAALEDLRKHLEMERRSVDSRTQRSRLDRALCILHCVLRNDR